jgi:tetratricopeptide (TPR) repeat protein
LLGLLVLVSWGFAQTSRADSLFIQANRYMNLEQYGPAVRLYEQILSMGYEHPDLYYNLGNAYYRLGIFGQAIWAYEKGLQYRPRDPDLNFNLKLARTRIRDRIEVPRTFFLLEAYRAVKSLFTLEDLLFAGSGFLLLASLVYMVQRFTRGSPRGLVQLVGVLIILAVVVHGVALDKYWEFSDTRQGIIVDPEVEAFSAPFERREAVLFKVHEGLKVEITQNQPDWLEIVLLDGKKGWVRAATIREL